MGIFIKKEYLKVQVGRLRELITLVLYIYTNTHTHHAAVLFRCSVVSDSLRFHGLQPARLLCPWIFHGISQARILEWDAISFSRGIFLTQRLNLGLLYWQVYSLPLCIWQVCTTCHTYTHFFPFSRMIKGYKRRKMSRQECPTNR